MAVQAAPAGGPDPPPPVVEGQNGEPPTSSEMSTTSEVFSTISGWATAPSEAPTATSQTSSSTIESSSSTTEYSSISSTSSTSTPSSSTAIIPVPTPTTTADESDWENSPEESPEPPNEPASSATTSSSSINIPTRPTVPSVSMPPSRPPVTVPGAPAITPGFGLPIPTSYAIAQPPVVTLQVVDGKLVPASATTQYSIALPGTSPAVGGTENGTTPAAVGIYVNPLVGYASEIISLTPPTCDRPCSSFKSHTTSYAARFPPLLSASGGAPTANETKTDGELTKCLCDYTYQAQTCGQCFAKNQTLAAGKEMAYFQEIVKGCEAAKEGKSISALNGTTGGASILPTPTGALDPSTKLDALQGVDKELLATICNATGLSKTNATAYESCKNGTNVAAILNTTDSALRQKLASMKNSPTEGPTGNDTGSGESVASYCDTVHFNDYFWSQTCHKESGGLRKLVEASAGEMLVGVCMLAAGLWLLL